MDIMITGATGLIGSAAVDSWKGQHTITVVGRSLPRLNKRFPGLSAMTWGELTKDKLASFDVVLNLAGENIGAKRWSKAQKESILNSRQNASSLLAKLCVELGPDSPRIINAGAISVYGFRDEVFTEDSLIPDPDCFLSQVAVEWEKALNPAKEAGVKTVQLRFSIVLAKSGGALAKLLTSFKVGAGSVLGDGEQYMSWVSLNDAVRALDFLLKHKDLTGAFNIVSNNAVKQKEFASSLAKHLRRPLVLRLPKSLVELSFGEMGRELLLSGQRVEPKRLNELGFRFEDDDLNESWDDIV